MSTEKDPTSTSASSDFGETAFGGRSQRRGRGRGRGRGGVGSRGRGTGRGRGRRSSVTHRGIDEDDQARLQDLQERRTAEMEAKLEALTPPQMRTLLGQVLTRLPGLIFDVMALLERPSPGGPDEPQLHWCICTNCRDMPTDLEKLCCRQAPLDCISNMAHMQYYISDEGVLRLARAAWNDIFAIDDHQEPGVEQRQFRHAAYRQFVLWQHGRLGEGNRVVIPSCVVWKIRDRFPDPNNQ